MNDWPQESDAADQTPAEHHPEPDAAVPAPPAPADQPPVFEGPAPADPGGVNAAAEPASQSSAGADATGLPAAEPGADAILAELRALGVQLTATLKAAAGTPEAEELRRELRAGVQALDRELRGTVRASRQATTRVSGEYRAAGVSRVRADLARALQVVNRALADLAAAIEPDDSSGDASTDSAGSTEP